MSTTGENPQDTITAPDDGQTITMDPPSAAPARRGKQGTANAAAAKLTRYRIYLTAGSLEAIHTWNGSRDDGADGIDVDVFPESAAAGDLIYVTTAPGADRDAAVEAMLDGRAATDGSGRATVVKAAHEAHVDLDFSLVPDSYVGAVPVHWEITPTRRIGGR